MPTLSMVAAEIRGVWKERSERLDITGEPRGENDFEAF